MTYQDFYRRPVSAAAVFLLFAVASVGLLTSCSTTPATSTNNAGFKFWVLRYKPPVDAGAWVPNVASAADPEGAALNIAVAMRQGNVNEWLSYWEGAERPQLTPAQSEALVHEWQSLRDAHVSILGRVVAEADVIVELSVGPSQGETGKIQIPLRHSHDRWWLATMDPSSEYLHWENSPNKLIDYIDPDSFQKHLNMIPGSKQKANADPAPAKTSTPVAGL